MKIKMNEFNIKLNWYEALEVKYTIKTELRHQLDMLSYPKITGESRRYILKTCRRLANILIQINDILKQNIYNY